MRKYVSSVIVLVLALGLTAAVAAGFGRPDYTLVLDFTNADGVVKGADVNINGVMAGKVNSLQVQGKVAALTVTIDPKFTPLHSGTKGVIRQLGLLGAKYVEVIDGSGGARELASGTELTIDSTTSPTDLDQVNAIFDAPTREKIKVMTNEGAIALGGRAQTLNDDILQLRNLAVAAAPFTGILDDHQAALDRATIAFDAFTQKLVKEDASLRAFVANTGSFMSAAQAHDQQLAGLLAHGDATFTRLNTALNGNQNALAGFFARGPSGIASTNYQVNASIPVVKATQPILPSLFEVLYNINDSSSGLIGTGDPSAPNSGTIWGLRAIAAPCTNVSGSPQC
jgi:virulence factor Mce-like protein